ncbi:unnamed protein product [Urochloa humidicola]
MRSSPACSRKKSSLTCLEVTLEGPKVREDHVDLIKDKIPHLPHITSLTVNVSEAFKRHNFGAGVANLLTRFTNLRDLSIHLPFFMELHGDLDEGLGLECDHPDTSILQHGDLDEGLGLECDHPDTSILQCDDLDEGLSLECDHPDTSVLQHDDIDEGLGLERDRPNTYVLHHDDRDEELVLECDHPNHWISNEISLDHLKEIELTGLTGTDCELWLMEVVLASAKRLRKVAISFNRECWQRQCWQLESKMDTFERMLIDEGMQSFCRAEHRLTYLV